MTITMIRIVYEITYNMITTLHCQFRTSVIFSDFWKSTNLLNPDIILVKSRSISALKDAILPFNLGASSESLLGKSKIRQLASQTMIFWRFLYFNKHDYAHSTPLLQTHFCILYQLVVGL